jgi:hypothetical protein
VGVNPCVPATPHFRAQTRFRPKDFARAKPVPRPKFARERGRAARSPEIGSVISSTRCRSAVAGLVGFRGSGDNVNMTAARDLRWSRCRVWDARNELSKRHPDLEIVLLESGGNNLAASFSPELVDASIYVIDVSGGDKIPHKGGPGVTRSDLLVINKIDLAPHVGASRDVMARDARLMRSNRPFVFMQPQTRRRIGRDRRVDSARSGPRGSDPLLIGNANATRSPRDVERDRAGSLSPVSSHAASTTASAHERAQ